MAEDLGSARLSLETDQSPLDRGLDAAEARSRSFLDRVGTGTKIAFKAVATTVATGLAAATVQGAQLNQVLNDLQAETGATGDDWEAMQAVVRRENGRTTASIDDIGAATKAMRQDLNLSGSDIDKYADKFFNAALVTKQSGEKIVKTTDDIADGFNVNVDRAIGSIDQIIASQEKWGGSIDGRLAVLPTLAKGLRGLNGTIDDGIALLNLASASGLNYTDVQKAINSAVGKFAIPPTLEQIIGLQDAHRTSVERANDEVVTLQQTLAKFVLPPRMAEIMTTLSGIADPLARAAAAQTIYNDEVAKFSADPLQRYIDILAAIPDDQARTQRAIEIFGPKAGAIWAQLAGQIAKSGGTLADFNVTQAEAGDKATEVAAKLDAGPIRSLKLLGERVGALLADAGSNPLITGIASFGTILGGFAPNLSGKITGGILAGVKGAWGKVAASAAISAVIAGAADKGATIYLKGLFAGDAINAAMKSVWARIAATSIGQAAIAGTASGTAFRTAASLAMVGLVAIVAVKLIFDYVDQQAKNVELLNDITTKAGDASIEALKGMRAKLADALEREKGNFDPLEDFFGLSQQNNIEQQLKAIDSIIASKTPQLADTAAGVGPAIADGLAAGAGAIDPTVVTDAMLQATASLPIVAAAAGAGAAQALAGGWESAGVGVGTAVKNIVTKAIHTAGSVWAKAAHDGGLRTAQALAQGFQDGRDAVKTQWGSFLDILKNAETPTKERARLLGELTSKALQAGLKSGDPYVRATAQTTKQMIIDRLRELETSSKNIGKAGMEALRLGLKSKDPDIRAAAQAIKDHAAAKLTMPGAFTAGEKITMAWAAGIASAAAIAAVIAAAQKAVHPAFSYMHGQSPPPEGPLHTIDKGGENVTLAWTSGLIGGIRKGRADLIAAVAGAADAVSSQRFPSLVASIVPMTAGVALAGAGAGALASAASLASSGGPTRQAVGDTYNQYVKVDGLLKARDSFEVATQLRRVNDLRTLTKLPPDRAAQDLTYE